MFVVDAPGYRHRSEPQERLMTLYSYLTPEWHEAAASIRDRFRAADTEMKDLVANITVTNVPFGDGVLELHSLPGVSNVFDPGHVDDAVVALSFGYDLARLILFDTSTMLLEMGFGSGQITATGATDELTSYWRTHIGDGAYFSMLEELRAITK
jgi:hypothetical protein